MSSASSLVLPLTIVVETPPDCSCRPKAILAPLFAVLQFLHLGCAEYVTLPVRGGLASFFETWNVPFCPIVRLSLAPLFFCPSSLRYPVKKIRLDVEDFCRWFQPFLFFADPFYSALSVRFPPQMYLFINADASRQACLVYRSVNVSISVFSDFSVFFLPGFTD